MKIETPGHGLVLIWKQNSIDFYHHWFIVKLSFELVLILEFVEYLFPKPITTYT